MGTAIRLSGTRGICSAPCAPLLEGVLRLSKNSFPIVAKRDNAKLGNHKPYHIFYLTFRTLFRAFAAIFEEPPVEGGSGAIARRSHAP